MTLATYRSFAFDNTKIFFAGDSSTTYCRESITDPDLYPESLFGRLKTSPPSGFVIEPQQHIVSQEPCSPSHPDVSGYGALKIVDWNTECLDPSGAGVCSWVCNDCPDLECEIHRPSNLFGEEADWCCCASRRACIDQSNAQYVILNLVANDLLQLSKFYGSDVDLIVEEAKSLTNYIAAQGRTAIWLTFYPISYGSLGGGKTSCSSSLSCLFVANSNAEYFYEQFILWLTSQSDAHLIDFFGYIKETYAPDPKSFIAMHGYDGLHLKPSGHQIYYDYAYPRLTSILAGINDQDGDACECEGDFEPDGDVDGTDALNFKADFYRKDCTELNLCNGDFICDGDVDGTDALLFKLDFFRKDCPSCDGLPCVYE